MKRSVIIAISLLLLCGAAFYFISDPSDISQINAVDGVADLRTAVSDGQSRRVTSGWESYPGKIYTPRDFSSKAVRLPVIWENKYGRGSSVGTHRMTLLLPVNKAAAIRFRSIDYSTKIHINGELADEIGKVGATKKDTIPRVGDCYFVFTPAAEKTEIILQYANFHHRKGGHPPELTIGSPEELQRVTQKSTFSQVMIAGLLFTAFLYHLALFLLYGRRKIFLYFALCCFTFAVRAMLPLIVFFWKNYNWFLMIRLEYILMFAGAALLMLFFRKLFAELLSKSVLWTTAALLGIYCIIVIFTNPAVFSRLLVIIQPLCILAVGYITIMLGLALKKGKLSIILAFSGIALFFVTVVNDVLYLNNLPNLGANLMPVGIAVFTLAYMIILSMEFAENERRLETAKLNEEKILAERNELEQLNRMRTEFFQNMNHDLKTPLTVISTDILNAADQLDYEMDLDDMRQSLKNAQQEIMRMARMVDSAMKFSYIQKNRGFTELLDIGAVLRSSGEIYRSVLAQRGNSLKLDIPESLPKINSNTDMILQVLLNLLSNANRQTQNGEISIIAAEENNQIKVTVRDNGEGVPEELISDLFNRGVSRDGTGLGLSICKTIIEAHNGDISLESEYGHGTAVTFTLPVSEYITPEAYTHV